MVLSKRQKLIILLGALAMVSYGTLLVYRDALHSTAGDRTALKAFASMEAESPSCFAPQAPALRQLSKEGTSGNQAGARTTGLRVPPLAFLEETVSGPRLIYQGQLTIMVKNFDEAFDRIQTISADLGGCLSDFQVQRPEKDHAQGTITLRVPPSQYFQALNKLRVLGQTESESSRMQDVTRQCLSLDTRIKHRREIESRMWDAMRNRATTVDSIAVAGNTLEGAEDHLDRLEAERYQLQQDVVNATIRLDLHESGVVRGIVKPIKSSVFEPVKRALQHAGTELISDASRVIYLVLVLAPWILAGCLIYRPVSKRVRHYLETRRQRASTMGNIELTDSTAHSE
jgi:hypothetical protein